MSHSYVSDDGIRTATIMLPKLTHVELSSCRYVTAKTVSILETTSEGTQKTLTKTRAVPLLFTLRLLLISFYVHDKHERNCINKRKRLR